MNWDEFLDQYSNHPGYTEQVSQPTQPRRLRAGWSMELAEDLRNMYGLDVEKVIMEQWLSETDHFEQHKELFKI